MPATEAAAPSLAAFSDAIAQLVQRTAQSVVALHARRRYPSTALAWQPGVLLTAAHTIRRETDITVILPDGTIQPATLAGVDTATDIAVLRTDPGHPATVRLNDAVNVRPGNYVVAVARGTDGEIAASSGIIARATGEWRTWRGARMDRLIQLDGGLWPGFSGAPIVDAGGEIIGIGTSGLARARAIVIPNSVLQRIGTQLLAHGRIAKPYLGVGTQPVQIPERDQEALGIRESRGLIVMSIAKGSPAATAGVALGDVIVAVDSMPVIDIDSLSSALAAKPVGAVVSLTLLRGGQLHTLEVTLGERPHAR